MTVVDDFEAERQRIEQLWSELKPEIIRDLVNVWIDKEQLQELKADVEKLEPKVIKLLEVLSTSRRHTAEYHAHTVHLVSLLHNVKSKESWRQKIIEDLNFISGVIDKIHEAIELRKKLRSSQQQIETTQITPHLQTINALCDELIRIRSQLSDDINRVRAECFKWPTRDFTNSKLIAELAGRVYEAIAPKNVSEFFSRDLKGKFKSISLEITDPPIGQIGAIGYEIVYSDKIAGKPYEQLIQKEVIPRVFGLNVRRNHVLYCVRPEIVINSPPHEKEKIKGKLVLVA